ncbi:hypothetical protein [Rhizobium sp. C4]|uniref:hypothetical protein n=1 Tax=Rhizobium sp. C4 TaxID=1349800 RepID=UPI001E4D3E56|nr:hypothetical protein [Rhizobium sp. C4]MCD2173901.1 hypothetical protein [Rhizobium sp. C4]
MHEENDVAFEQLMRDAAVIGMSERDIVACFSEWLLINCWHFDGADFRIFGNFRGLEHMTEIVEKDGNRSFQGKMSEAKSAMARANLARAMDAKGFSSVRHPMSVDDGPPRDFISIGQYKQEDDGKPGLIGVTFECFKPLRQIAVTESAQDQAAE